MTDAERPDVAAAVARTLSTYARWSRATPLAEQRRDFDALFAGNDRPEHAFEPVSAGGVPGAWIAAPGVEQGRAVLFLHGGGFRLGSVASHRTLAARLSEAAGCAVLAIDYRLAPEHRFPAAADDALAAWTWLEDALGSGAPIALAGDSAGGGLALSLALGLRDAGRRLPAACLLISPWTDMTAGGDSYRTRAAADPLNARPAILALARSYLGPEGDPADPRASPLRAELAGLPPLLIQVGDRETVLDDSRVLASRARAAGVAVDLRVYDGMIHAFPLYDELPEAGDAIAAAGLFLRQRLTGAMP